MFSAVTLTPTSASCCTPLLQGLKYPHSSVPCSFTHTPTLPHTPHPTPRGRQPPGFVLLSPGPSTIGAPPRLLEAATAALLALCCPAALPAPPVPAAGWLPGKGGSASRQSAGQLWEHSWLRSKVLECSSCSKKSGIRCAEQQG